MAPTGDTYNIDWILSTVTNAHCANHLDWFIYYKPFKTQITSSSPIHPSNIDVQGIGDVELRVKKPNPKARPSYSTILLHDVLYCPTAICNQISISSLIPQYNVTLQREGSRIIRDNIAIGIIDCPKLWKLRLSGQSPNYTSLDKDGMYSLSFIWSGEERARWERVKDADVVGSGRVSRVSLYTDAEKKWLKENWGGEFKFLRAHGLKIHDEEDRAEGRIIVRAMMHEPQKSNKSHVSINVDEDEDDYDSEDEDDEFVISYTDGQGVKPIIPHADGHMADYQFSEDELIWIEKNYGNSASFLATYGLKFYDDDDCKEGRQLLRGLMREGA